MRSGLADFFFSITRFFDPETCYFCRKPVSTDRFWCNECDDEISRVTVPYCRRCGLPLPGIQENRLCQDCLTDKAIFNQARSLLIYEKRSRELVQAVKYQHQSPLVRQLLDPPGRKLIDELAEPDLIIPVPLHSSRLRERGYNQALLICRKLFAERKRDIEAFVLERNRPTSSQTGMSGRERRRNLKNAFTVRNQEKIRNRRILLVDDVFTTGTTVNECARTLYRAGAAQVDVLTLARVVMAPNRPLQKPSMAFATR